MLLLSPFLNKLINKLNKRNFQKVLVICLFIPIYAQYSEYNPVCDVVTFSYVYLLISYIKKYGSKLVDKLSNKPWYILTIIIVVASIFISNALLDKSVPLKVISYLISQTFGKIIRHSNIMLITSILIFFNVLNKKPSYNKKINKISSYCLGIYLFHENAFFNMPLVPWAFVKAFNYWGFMSIDVFFPISFLSIVILVFIFGAIIEAIRNYIIQKPFMSWVSKKYENNMNLIDNWFNSF